MLGEIVGARDVYNHMAHRSEVNATVCYLSAMRAMSRTDGCLLIHVVSCNARDEREKRC